MIDARSGWLADPSGRHEYRYFADNRWTDHVADHGVLGLDSLVAATAASTGGPPSAHRSPFSWSGLRRNADSHMPSSRQTPLGVWVLGALLIGAIVALAVIAGLPTSSTSGSSAAGNVSTNAARLEAKAALFVRSDLPAGWTWSTASNTNNSSFPGEAQLATCLGVPSSLLTSNPPSASSKEFISANDAYTVQDNVSVYASAEAAQADYASLANPKAPSCLTSVLDGPAKRALDQEIGSQASVGSITVSRASAADFAPGSANFTAVLPITESGTTVPFTLTVVDFVKGNEEQTVTLTSVNGTFPATLAKHLTTVADSRI